MQRKFITNLALLLILNLLIKPFWILGIDRTVQNLVGAEEYGFYYALLNFSFLFNIILDFGITNFNNKNIAQNNQLLNKHLSSIIVLRLLLACLYFCISFISGLIIGYKWEHFSILLILCFNQFLISFILYLRSNLAGLHLFKTDSFISVLDRLIMIAICAFLIWGRFGSQHFQISWFIYAQTVSYVLTCLITLVIVIDRARLKKLNTSKVFLLMILKKSYPYAILVLLMTFYNRIDSVMLERLVPNGSYYAGIYAAAYRLLDSANMIAYLFAGLLLPIFARMIKLKEKPDDLVKLAFSLLIVPATLISLGSYFFRNEIMELLYHQNIDLSAEVFGLLMFCFISVSLTYIYGTLLTANGNLKELNIMAGSGMLLNIFLNFILIPKYHVYGAAISSLLTQGLTSIAQILIVQRLFKFRANLFFISRFFLFLLFAIGLNYLLGFLGIYWIIALLSAFGASLVFAFFIRLISIKNIYYILRYG